jgi:pimeloyl-ACP methyl ester carboxylesterase
MDVPATPDGPPDTERVALFVHGILGSAKNWYSFARRLAQTMPGWRCVLVDLRHHGESRTTERPDTLTACAADLDVLVRHLGITPRAVIGHSFGGKVALVYARDFRPQGLRDVWVLDANPSARDPDGRASGDQDEHEVVRVLTALRDVPLPVASRASLTTLLTARGFSPQFSAWMTTNLAPRPEGGFGWRFDLDGVTRLLEDYFVEDLWPFCESVEPGGPLRLHMLRGARSDRFRQSDVERLEALDHAGHLRHWVLENAGHWVHVDAPEVLSSWLRETLTAGP